MKKKDITEADKALFRRAVADVRPLNRTKRAMLKPTANIDASRAPSRHRPQREEALEVALPLSLSMEAPLVSAQAELSYQCQRLTRQQRRAAQQGTLSVHASLDLHHSTVAQARGQILEFIQQCLRRQYAWGLIIHGKGLHSDRRYPVLKNQINQWLRQLKEVKAFCSAHPRHGGLGAVYVFF